MEKMNQFKELLGLHAAVDVAFRNLKEQYPDEVCCRPGCVDCCHACFDISFVEAALISFGFQRMNDMEKRQEVLQRAKTAGLEIEEQLSNLPEKRENREVLEQFSLWRIRCPLLGDDQQCSLYDYRPVTCRVYGLPTAIGGQGHVCGFSGFDQGKTYPTIKMDDIAGHLLGMSQKLAEGFSDPIRQWGRKRMFVYEALTLNLVDPEKT
ncbi:YkgJ family cysteine cluster protein [Thermodesulfobacteriota bacterium]